MNENPQTQAAGDNPQTSGTRLFIQNFPWSFDEARLENVFKRLGEVRGLVICRDKNGASKGFGFLYMDEEPAAKAIEELNGATIGQRTLLVAPARNVERLPAPRLRRESQTHGSQG